MDIATAPVLSLKGVGPKLAPKLKRLGIETIQDVLFHLPRAYQDRTRLTPIGQLTPGTEALIAGEIQLTDVVFRRRRSLICRVADGTGHVLLRFFHFGAVQQANLARGRRVRCFGAVRAGPLGLEMAHPEYTLLTAEETVAPEDRLTPIYPTTEGVHQLSLRRLARQAVEQYLSDVVELLPANMALPADLPSLRDALDLVHQPPPGTDVGTLIAGTHPAVQRLALEEIVAHYLSLRQLRARARREAAASIHAAGRLVESFLDALPFAPTAAQRRVLDEIAADLAREHPMQRLVQGDVGCGKTVVAAATALRAIESGYQVALMVPTELLAEQHASNLGAWFTRLGVPVISLSAKLSTRERRSALAAIAGQTACIAVGTHALFQQAVAFGRLGLIVIDEQHRFGVDQRLALLQKGAREDVVPHQLIMTATPIPRTLAQTFYADLDVSVIDELPPGRTPVETVAIAATRRPEVVQRVEAACQAGRQAYWVCPLIEESEQLAAEAATQTFEALREALPTLALALVHGRLAAREKDAVMARFKAGEIQLLVATTVIEVGVDVPNASLMIIENAERLGLAQLHQLRGRVGRGAAKSSCVLLYRPPLSEAASRRLEVMRATNDGFEIAQQDLEMRGPGELLGTRQTGEMDFHIADLARDHALLHEAPRLADAVVAQNGDRVNALVRRWLGSSERYASV